MADGTMDNFTLGELLKSSDERMRLDLTERLVAHPGGVRDRPRLSLEVGKMADDHHKWQIGSELPLIRPHSLAKHRVIEQYLIRYVDVLTANPRMPEFCLTLVDG